MAIVYDVFQLTLGMGPVLTLCWSILPDLHVLAPLGVVP
jgi:hypothetical protein